MVSGIILDTVLPRLRPYLRRGHRLLFAGMMHEQGIQSGFNPHQQRGI